MNNFKIKAVFKGFTNGNHNMMYLDHPSNNSWLSFPLPAVFKVEDEELKTQVAQLKPGVKITIIASRYQDGHNLGAKMVALESVEQ